MLRKYKNESMGNIIIACTDLNVVLEKSRPPINVIDSSKCLAEAVVRSYLEDE
jgi:aspartate racemase